MTGVNIVDSGQVIAQGQALRLNHTLTKNGGTFNLTGATVTATIRNERKPSVALDAALEDHAVAVSDAPNGVVDQTIASATMANVDVPDDDFPSVTWPHLIQYKVVNGSVTDYMDPVRIWVRRAID